MSDESLNITKSAARQRALRAARAVAIVASLGVVGCSSIKEQVREDSGTANQDSGAVDASATEDAALADAAVAADATIGEDAALADASEPDAELPVDAATADARTPDDPMYPCVFDEELDFECCSSMGFPPGCPVIGPFVPPSMNLA